MSTTTPHPALPTASDLPLEEVIETLTGYEEQAIADRFGGQPLMALLEADAIRATRAVVFTLGVRALKAAEVQDPARKAWEHCMGMTMRQLGEFFPDEADEPMPEAPVSAEGNAD